MEATAINELLEKPIYTMSGREFISLLRHGASPEQPRPEANKPRLIKGRGTLAAEIGVSVMTVIEWERQKFLKPKTKIGRVLIYDLDQVLTDLQKAGKNINP